MPVTITTCDAGPTTLVDTIAAAFGGIVQWIAIEFASGDAFENNPFCGRPISSWSRMSQQQPKPCRAKQDRPIEVTFLAWAYCCWPTSPNRSTNDPPFGDAANTVAPVRYRLRPVTSAQTYYGYGHAIRSSIVIPGAIAMANAVAENADIRVDERPLALRVATRIAGPYRLSPDGLCFNAPGVACYLCTAEQIVVERARGARDDMVGGFLVATALPACLWMRGAFVLHAGAIVLPGSDTAVAIAGASGSGKSVVLSQLVDTGGKLIADDTLTLGAEASGANASGLPGGYMLGTDPRVFRAVPPTSSLRSATLGALAILRHPRDSNGLGFSRLTGTDALVALLANRHRPRIPKLLGLEQVHLPLLAELASRLPIYSWGRREGEPRLDDHEQAFLASF